MAVKKYTCTPEAYDFFHEATLALSQVEANGIRVDVPYLEAAIQRTDDQIKAIARELKDHRYWKMWKRRFGDKSKLTSRDQLGEMMFKVLGNKPVPRQKDKHKKTDKESADEAAFANITDDEGGPFIKLYFQMEKLRKASGTYLKGILRETVNGYCHPNFNLHFAVTYRSSSDNPNFQNMPTRIPMMAELIRQAFISRDGYQLGEIDFSGIEVRIAACYNKDPNLIRYIEDSSTDMHRDTAADIFMLPLEFLIKEAAWAKKSVRDWSKNRFVFPSFYGSVYFQTAADLWQAVVQSHSAGNQVPGMDMTVKQYLKSKGIKGLGDVDPKGNPKPGTFAHHVKQVEKIFWEKRFRVYAEWKKRWWNKYLQTGGLEMYTGLTCWGVFKRNDVINYPVQGSAFHCLLWSLIQIQKWLRKNKMKTKIVGQIHDSIVADIYLPERDDFLAICKEVMTQRLREHWKWIIVPMEVEVELCPPGESWFKKEKFNL